MANTDNRAGADRAYVLPFLAPLYGALDDVAFTALRIATGALLLPHGAQKVFGLFGGSLAGTTAFLAKVGYSNPQALALTIGLTELIGGVCLVLGLLTRPAAVAVAVFMAFAVSFHMTLGFFWTSRGFEYPLLWGVVALFFAVKGAGPWSVDRMIGREI